MMILSLCGFFVFLNKKNAGTYFLLPKKSSGTTVFILYHTEASQRPDDIDLT